MTKEPVNILDDEGNDHSYVICQIPSLQAVQMLSIFEKTGATNEMLDQLVDSVMETISATKPDYDPIKSVVDAACHRILTNGETDLITKLLIHAERDGVQLTKAVCEVVFSGNLGEMQRALAAVVEESYRGFFASRVEPLREWGERLVKQAHLAFQRLLENPSLSSAMNGLSTMSGLGLRAGQD